ncbi:hypothetical protein [Amycolatopsis sp. lyj-84]|uniref:hypothetical protein n=1 Tax=Amycolatopsis sp. lyj-84 TaxID=2789284 RepID=UPI00397B1100
MKESHLNPSPTTWITFRGQAIKDRSDVGIDLVEPIAKPIHFAKPGGNFPQLVLNDRKSARNIVVPPRRWFPYLRGTSTRKHSHKVGRVQVKRKGQRLKRAITPATLRRVVLDFANRGLGNLRTRNEFALTDTEFSHALIDHSCDCRPVFRHVFLRAPPRRRD